MGNANKKRFNGGEMRIEIIDDIESFKFGDEIHGVVHLLLKTPFPAFGISIELEGKDTSYQEDENDAYYRKEICYRVGTQVTAFEKSDHQQCGSKSFPFTLKTTGEGPQSQRAEKSQFYSRIRYYLKAQMVPVNIKNLTNTCTGKSQLRCKHKVFMSPAQPKIKPPRYDVQKQLTKADKVFGSNSMDAQITLNKTVFMPGEQASFQIAVDNSKYDKPVELILKHMVLFKGGLLDSGARQKHEKELKEEKFVICGPHQKFEGRIDFTLPLSPPKKTLNRPKKTADILNELLPASIQGQSSWVWNYFELHFSHKNVVGFGNSGKVKFYFQLVQPAVGKSPVSFQDFQQQQMPMHEAQQYPQGPHYGQASNQIYAEGQVFIGAPVVDETSGSVVDGQIVAGSVVTDEYPLLPNGQDGSEKMKQA